MANVVYDGQRLLVPFEGTGGGTGDWIWSGTANQAGAKAVIKSISGTLCIDPG